MMPFMPSWRAVPTRLARVRGLILGSRSSRYEWSPTRSPAADGGASTPEGGTTLPSTQIRRSSTRSPRRSRAPTTYRLYVIRLKRSAAMLKKVRAANPHAIDGKPVVYVGMTSQSRKARFAEHRAGGMRASSIVTKFGKHLFPWAYRDRPTYRRKEAAEAAERTLAEELRGRGWTVWQN